MVDYSKSLSERADGPISVVTSPTQWEQMRDFHSRSTGWILPTMWSKNTTVLGELVLVWTMLQPTLQAAWRHTYAWHDKLDQFPAPDSTRSDRLFHADSISNALWSSQS